MFQKTNPRKFSSSKTLCYTVSMTATTKSRGSQASCPRPSHGPATTHAASYPGHHSRSLVPRLPLTQPRTQATTHAASYPGHHSRSLVPRPPLTQPCTQTTTHAASYPGYHSRRRPICKRCGRGRSWSSRSAARSSRPRCTGCGRCRLQSAEKRIIYSRLKDESDLDLVCGQRV